MDLNLKTGLYEKCLSKKDFVREKRLLKDNIYVMSQQASIN